MNRLLIVIILFIALSCEVARKEEEANSQSNSNLVNNTETSPVTSADNNSESQIGLKIGQVAPDISLPDPEGKIATLSSLRGKYVLLDFWASWCGPCRQENPNVVRIYQQYKDMGFEVFSVSLDREKTSWVKAIEADGMEWKHASDLGMWESAVVPLYKIDAIPMTFLLDKNGKVIDKNLRGKKLDKKLEELFKTAK